ncbi:outer membrane lipoprotein-sorting protein [Halorhodospira halophila]|uniref:Uncharacterized protein TP-0789 domain-containing protein n=1 Tax=Halorhodospira halophila (strain DSM 244 / SL1) TaxID=349124 RepID=A1WX83_HALHL|nr:outer membrane lipoprotein-sorting protein [Halorhodospira halophila]ABM62295.1 conserved hypothetical protein [Halorhodospira halophila SL1]MBK1729270.1 outer membrane lipoprotein-sorting protein [Halorhodospira halophila]
MLRASPFSGVLGGVILLTAGLVSLVAANEEPADGEELAQWVYDRPEGDDAVQQGRMVLDGPGRSERERSFYEYRLQIDDEEVWNLVRFTAPSDVADTAMLTRDYPDGSTDQWLYLPALDRVRRVASERMGGRFVDSDFFFEDLRDRKVRQDEHEYVGRDELEGLPVFRLESRPVEGDNSVYTLRDQWVHEESLVPLRIDYYQGDDEPAKRLTVQALEQHQGYWTVVESTMEDLDSGHQTRFLVEQVVYDQGLPQDLFSRAALSDPGGERAYRP